MSSASLKSLMAAKKASSTQRITHPFASYDRQSRLTCTLCPATVLKHDNLWGAHLISKGHRVNAQRYEREQHALREREEAAVKGKRKRSRSAESEVDESNKNEKGKRAREGNGTQQSEDDDDDDEDEDGPADENRTSALPDDFFTDPSQVPTRSTSAQDDATDPTPATAEEDDPEWAAFEASLQQDAPQPTTTTTTTTSSTAKATITAAPVAYEFGAPKVAEEGEEQGEPEEEEEEEETEEERLERLEREQREEIMERIEAEEREQLEADSKVTALKLKLEAIKEARRKKKTAVANSGEA